MPVNNDKITTIDCFPNDNISRVVYRYGGLVRNEDNDSTNPFVEVLLIEIRKSDQWLFLDKCSEEVYLKAYSNVLDAKKQLNAYFEFYNLKRPHSSLDKMTPDEFYYDQLPQQNKVA